MPGIDHIHPFCTHLAVISVICQCESETEDKADSLTHWDGEERNWYNCVPMCTLYGIMSVAYGKIDQVVF